MARKRKLVRKTVTHLVVGMRHRVTISTRRMIAAAVEERGAFQVALEREPENPSDYWALKVVIREEGNPYDGIHVGYLTRDVAKVYSPRLDRGEITIRRATLVAVDPQEGDGEVVLVMGVPLNWR